MNNQKGFINIAVVVVVLAVVAISGYFVFVLKPRLVMAPVQSRDYIVIKEWDVEFQKPSNMSDLQYSRFGTDENTIAFNTQQLMHLDQSTGGKDCVFDQVPIGVLSRVKNFDDYKTSDHYIPVHVQIGDYYYFFTGPQATCSDNKQVQTLESQQISDLSGTVLRSLRQITVVSTASWKTYTNTKYGFELRYPDNLTASTIDNVLSDGTVLVADISNNDGSIGINIKNAGFDPKHIQGISDVISNAKQIQLGAKVAYQFSDGDGPCGGQFVQTDLNGKTFEINFVTCEESQNPLSKDKALINGVLSTFKFTK